MKDKPDMPDDPGGALAENTGKRVKQERLKLALRENLKRRKSQARGRSEPGPASNNVDDASPYHRGGEQPDE